MKQTDILKILNDNNHPRTPGSAEERAAAKYLQRYCEALGLVAHKEAYSLFTYSEELASLVVDGKEIPCRTKPGAISGKAEGKLYYLENTSALALKKCKDRIVLTERKVWRSLYRRIAESGAVGLLTLSGCISDALPRADASPTRFSMEEEKAIPWVTLHISDGLNIVRRRARYAEIETKQSVHTGESLNVIVDLKGELDETIVISAHYDSTFLSHGAYDNFSGCIALLYLAERLSKMRLKRNVRLLWCGGEEWGLLGSKAYCTAHKDEAKHIVMNINLDMLGCDMGEFVAFSCADEATQDLLDRFGRRHRFPMTARHAIRSSDSNSFLEIGVPAISFARYSPAEVVHCHTPEDTAEVVSPRQLLLDAEFICKFVIWATENDDFCHSITISDYIREEIEKYFEGR